MLHLLFNVIDVTAYAVGWLVIIIATSRVVLGPDCFQGVRDTVYANFVNLLMKDRLKEALKSTKTELFSSMANLKSLGPDLAKKNALRILEIGVGTGANLEFYPAGSRLHCVDPNRAFEAFFRRECLQKAQHLHPEIRFIAERGESMPSVADGSVDAVVVSKVLCSVTHLDQVFREVRRVLVPGGKFYFLEHVAHPSGSWRRRLQDALSDSGLWPALFGGCTINLEFEQRLRSSGFSSVDYGTVLVVGNAVRPASAPLPGLALVNPFAYGVATK